MAYKRTTIQYNFVPVNWMCANKMKGISSENRGLYTPPRMYLLISKSRHSERWPLRGVMQHTQTILERQITLPVIPEVENKPIKLKTLCSRPQAHVTPSLHIRGFYFTNTSSFLHCPQPALQLASPSNSNNNISNPMLFCLFSKAEIETCQFLSVNEELWYLLVDPDLNANKCKCVQQHFIPVYT